MLKVDYRPLVQRLQKVLNDKKRLNFELSFTIQSVVAKIYKLDLLVCCLITTLGYTNKIDLIHVCIINNTVTK